MVPHRMQLADQVEVASVVGITNVCDTHPERPSGVQIQVLCFRTHACSSDAFASQPQPSHLSVCCSPIRGGNVPGRPEPATAGRNMRVGEGRGAVGIEDCGVDGVVAG